MRAIIIQRPVGQGGLCEGRLGLDDRRLNWVYDCGSNQQDSLDREIEKVSKTLAVLFISHLDTDHVSGIDKLMTHAQAEEVVLPYLNDTARLLVAAQAISQGRASRLFLDFLADPSGWLLERGAQRVTFVGNADELGEDFPPIEPIPPRKPEESEAASPRTHLRWSQTAGSVNQAVGTVPAGAMLQVVGATQAVDWCFIPHAYGPSQKLLTAFRAELNIRFPKLDDASIALQVKTATGRSKLERCYDELWSDHNLVSMSLYAGPAFSDAEVCIHNSGGEGFWRPRPSLSRVTQGGGWLTTGDANLKRKGRRRAFLGAYRHFLERTNVFVAPHHGAASSWHDALLDHLPGLLLGVVAAGPNQWGHPNDAVTNAFDRAEVDLARVNEVHQVVMSVDLD